MPCWKFLSSRSVQQTFRCSKRPLCSCGCTQYRSHHERALWVGQMGAPELSAAQDVAEDFEDSKLASTDGYVFNTPADMQDIRMQRQAIWGLLKRLGSHILREGVNLTRITLPVRVFEPRSFLQRLTDNWAYIHLLEQAADAADPADRMRYLVLPSVPNPIMRLLGQGNVSCHEFFQTIAAHSDQRR